MLDFLNEETLTGRVPMPKIDWITTIVHDLTWDGFDHEVRVYADGQVELYFDGVLFKSYHHGVLPRTNPFEENA